MTLDDAMECDEITVAEAIAELLKQAPDGRFVERAGWIVDLATQDYIAEVDSDGCVNGGDVLGWLGY